MAVVAAGTVKNAEAGRALQPAVHAKLVTAINRAREARVPKQAPLEIPFPPRHNGHPLATIAGFPLAPAPIDFMPFSAGRDLSTTSQGQLEVQHFACCGAANSHQQGQLLTTKVKNEIAAWQTVLAGNEQRRESVKLLSKAGEDFWRVSNYAAAYTCFRDAMQTCHPQHDRDLWMEVSESVVDALGIIGRTDEALAVAEQFAQIGQERELDFDDPDAQMPLHTLAWCYTKAGRHDKALAIRYSILSSRRKVFGESDSRTVNAKISLGRALRFAKGFEEAEPLLRAGLADRMRTFGSDHWMVGCASDNLNWLLTDAGKSTEARG